MGKLEQLLNTRITRRRSLKLARESAQVAAVVVTDVVLGTQLIPRALKGEIKAPDINLGSHNNMYPTSSVDRGTSFHQEPFMPSYTPEGILPPKEKVPEKDIDTNTPKERHQLNIKSVIKKWSLEAAAIPGAIISISSFLDKHDEDDRLPSDETS